MSERSDLLKNIGRGLQIAAIAGASVALEPRNVTSNQIQEQSVNPTREMLVENHRLSIEQRFGIKLQTLGEYAQEINFGPIISPEFSKEWTTTSLGYAETILNILPPHFYEPDEDGRPLRITLFSLRAGAAGLMCFTENCNMEELIEYVSQDYVRRDRHPETMVTIGINDYEMALTVFAHELTHRITPIEFRDYSDKKDVGDHLLRRIPVSPWFDKIDSIFGQPYSQVAEELHETAQNSEEQFRLEHGGEPDFKTENLSLSEMNDYNFYYYFQYGVSQKLPLEFLAVLGQNYVRGREFFVRNYGKFLSAEITESLYTFTKEDIYKGYEYENMFLINGQKSSEGGKSIKKPDSLSLELMR
jgi:hypothetical protein